MIPVEDSPRRSQATRERLMAAAVQVFAERGYEAATVRDICRRAGTNVAAVNYHFGDKHRLYGAIFDTVFTLLRARRRRFLPPHRPPEERLRVFIQALFEEMFHCLGDADECTRLAAMYLMEMVRPTDVLDRVVQEYIRHDAEELRDIVAALLGPRAGRDTVVDCSASIIGQVLYYYHARPLIERLHPEGPPPEQRITELVEHISRFSVAGVRAVGARSEP
ncbi:MAG: CerR family C-terminal domain-containing protein [Gammaproteobacteria bacterium]|nr:CerR family C-terminal domain-containing protein [Gammaproteobacteria bacterium]